MIGPHEHEEMLENDINYVKQLAKFNLEHRERMIQYLLEGQYQFGTVSYGVAWEFAAGDPNICGNPSLMRPEEFK